MTRPVLLRRLVLFGAPLALAVLEIFHPNPGNASEAIEQSGRFLWFHMVQLPLVALMALAVYLLTSGLQGRSVTVSRWAAGVFAIFFSAYDAAAGIATGFVWSQARGLPPGDQSVVFEAAEDMPGLSVIFVLSILGTLGWVVAVAAAAVALRGAGVSRGPFVLLILAAVFLMGGHPFPFGTLAFGSFLAAAVWVELAPTGGPAEATAPAQPLGVPRP